MVSNIAVGIRPVSSKARTTKPPSRVAPATNALGAVTLTNLPEAHSPSKSEKSPTTSQTPPPGEHGHAHELDFDLEEKKCAAAFPWGRRAGAAAAEPPGLQRTTDGACRGVRMHAGRFRSQRGCC